jgi:hypothetical protein
MPQFYETQTATSPLNIITRKLNQCFPRGILDAGRRRPGILRRACGVAESAQAIGSENRQTFRLASGITINRSFSRVKNLKAGTLVLRMVSPLQGREI